MEQPANQERCALREAMEEFLGWRNQIKPSEREEDSVLCHLEMVFFNELETRTAVFVYERGSEPGNNAWFKACQNYFDDIGDYLAVVGISELRTWIKPYTKDAIQGKHSIAADNSANGKADLPVHQALCVIGNIHANGSGDHEALAEQYKAFTKACEVDELAEEHESGGWRDRLLLRPTGLVRDHRPDLV